MSFPIARDFLNAYIVFIDVFCHLLQHAKFVHLGKHRKDSYWSVVITLLQVVYFRNRKYYEFFARSGKGVLSNTFAYDVR